MDVDSLTITGRRGAFQLREHVSHLLSRARAPAVDRRFANSLLRKLKLLYQNDRPAADFSGNARESILDALPRMKVSFHYELRNGLHRRQTYTREIREIARAIFPLDKTVINI